MALTLTITPKELERQAALAFEGEAYEVFLAYDPNGTYSAASTTANWKTKELATANGYAAVTGTIAAGSYNSSLGRYDLPLITAQFTASGAGYVFDTIVVVVGGATYPHSITKISPEQGLFAGQSRSYQIRLIQDD